MNRSILHRLLNARHVAQRLHHTAHLARVLGLRTAWLFFYCRVTTIAVKDAGFAIRPRRHQFAVKTVEHRLVMRSCSSDVYVAEQAFVVEEHKPLASLTDIRLIVDCGANVGYTAAYLLSRYREAVLVAIEPDPVTFELLKDNLAPYGERAVCIRAAVWSSGQRAVSLSRGAQGDGLDWSTAVLPDDANGDTSVVHLDSIIASFAQRGRGIDLLKIDIEGAEEAVFNDAVATWPDQTRNLSVELYGAACAAAFNRFMRGRAADVSTHDELTVCLSLRRSRFADGARTAPNAA